MGEKNTHKSSGKNEENWGKNRNWEEQNEKVSNMKKKRKIYDDVMERKESKTESC